jgi:hypothetical protein
VDTAKKSMQYFFATIFLPSHFFFSVLTLFSTYLAIPFSKTITFAKISSLPKVFFAGFSKVVIASLIAYSNLLQEFYV